MMIKCFDKISKFINCEEGDIVEKLNLFKSSIKDEYLISQIDLLLSDNEFINNFNNEEKVIIHDDLNVNNILYDEKKLSFVDFSGLKKYTKSMQVVSFIALYYLCEDREINIVNFVNKIDSKLDINQINKLILFRLIKAYYYVSNNYDYRINTIYN